MDRQRERKTDNGNSNPMTVDDRKRKGVRSLTECKSEAVRKI